MTPTTSIPLLAFALGALALAWPAQRARRGRVGVVAGVAPLVLFPLLTLVALLLRKRFGGLLPDPAMWLLAMAFFGYAFALPLGYAALCLRLRGRRPKMAALGLALSLIALALGSWAWLVEPSRKLIEQHYEVVTARAPSRPLRILHLSDLQTDGLGRRERLVLEAIARGKPDLILFTGDFMNADHPRMQARVVVAANAFSRALRAPLGAFAVLGDWDGWGDDWPAQLRGVLRGSQLKILRNERVLRQSPGDAEGITIFGVDGGPLGEPRRPTIAGDTGLRIVIVHNPDTATAVLRPGEADLILAGHTHGGQIALPGIGALITHTKLGFAGGAQQVHGIPLLISRGIGMRGNNAPRIRFNCPPEISWITVRRP